jgi:hypothetical protein
MCCTFSASQLPLVCFATLLFNGIWTNMNRKFHGVAIWNEIGGASTISTCSDEDNRSSKIGNSNFVSATALSILKANQSLQRQLSQIVHNIEVFNNMFTFADSRVSIIVYGILLFVSILSSIWISLFSVRQAGNCTMLLLNFCILNSWVVLSFSLGDYVLWPLQVVSFWTIKFHNFMQIRFTTNILHSSERFKLFSLCSGRKFQMNWILFIGACEYTNF